MINAYRRIAIWSVVALVITLGLFGSRFRRDNPDVDLAVLQGLKNEAQVNFDAPLLELATWPVPHVDSYDSKTKSAVVGMYSWFGIRVGGVTMNDCQFYKNAPIDTEVMFECGGGTIDYLF